MSHVVEFKGHNSPGMADAVEVIRTTQYKTKGRGRGVLGLKDLRPCRRPGEKKSAPPLTKGGENPSAKSIDAKSAESSEKRPAKAVAAVVVVVVLYDYTANPNCPGGFSELTVRKGQILELLGEREDNEHWWRVRDEDGNTGCVPASYVIKKENQALPWLELAALQNQEEERKERVKRLQQQQAAATEGRGFGLPSKAAPKPYVSAYTKTGSVAAPGGKQFYCEVCDKQLNGPKPYAAHMSSKAHKEEMALLQD